MKRFISVILVLVIALGCLTVAVASGTKLFKTTGKCHLRVEPDKNSKKVTTIPKGTRFRASDFAVDNRGVTWQFGDYKGQFGWVSMKNLKEIEDDFAVDTPKPTKKPKPTPKPINWNKFKDAGYYVTITCDSLNMRKAPDTSYATIRAYQRGDVLYAIRSNGSWMEVLDESRKITGYMSAKYLTKYTAPVEPDPTEGPKTIVPTWTMINPANLGSCAVAATFDANNITKSVDGIVTISNITIYEADHYDLVDIAQMKVGDTIIVSGMPVRIETIDEVDYCFEINGGFENGGVTLTTEEDTNGWRTVDYNDAPTFTRMGTAMLNLNPNAVFYDSSDLESEPTLVEGAANIMTTIMNSENKDFTCYNTELVIENNEIVAINRVYVP